MSRSPHRPPAEQAPEATARPGLAAVVLATLAVLVTAADTYVVVLALPDLLPGIGVAIDHRQRRRPRPAAPANPTPRRLPRGLHRPTAWSRPPSPRAGRAAGPGRLPAAVRPRL